MSLTEALLHHAFELLAGSDSATDVETHYVALRRAVSAAYYALFHCLSDAAVLQIAPHAHPMASNRIYRWLDHGEMKRICEQFTLPQLKPPLRELLGATASPEMRTVAFSFVRLQEARHSADYDRAFRTTSREAFEMVTLAAIAVETWGKISDTAEANVFVLSLLLWKNWEKRI